MSAQTRDLCDYCRRTAAVTDTVICVRIGNLCGCCS